MAHSNHPQPLPCHQLCALGSGFKPLPMHCLQAVVDVVTSLPCWQAAKWYQ